MLTHWSLIEGLRGRYRGRHARTIREHLTQSGLLSAAEISSFQDSLPPDKRPKDGEALARELVHANKLTKYQAQVVYQGRPRGWSSANTWCWTSSARAAWAWCSRPSIAAWSGIVAVKMIRARP